jgi:hypothetical protein
MQNRALARTAAEKGGAKLEAGAMPLTQAIRSSAGADVGTLARETSPGVGPRNYNLFQFETHEEALEVIQGLAASRVAAKGLGQPHTWAEVTQEAQEYTYEQLMGRPLPKGGVTTQGRRWGDTEITAAAQLLGGHVERLVELNKAYVAGALNDAQKLEFRLVATRAASLEEMLSNEAREAARTLNVLKMAKAPRQTASAIRADAAALIELGGDTNLQALSQLIAQYGSDPAKMLRAVKVNERMIGWGDMAREYAINNMFSMVTHGRNVGGNFIRMAGDLVIEGPTKALIDKVARPASRMNPGQYDQRYVREIVLKLKGLADGFGEAVRLSRSTLLEKPNVLSGTTKVEMNAMRPAITGANVEMNLQRLMKARNGAPVLSMAQQGIIDWFGIVARRHTNLLQTMDTFFRALNTRSELYAGLYRQGRQKGLSHADATAEMYRGIELPTAESYRAAADAAEEMISAQPLPMWRDRVNVGPAAGDPVRFIGGLVNAGLANNPWAKFLAAPFLKTPVNLASWVYRRLPGVGLLQTDTGIALNAVWKSMTGDAAVIEQGSGAAFSRVMTQQAVGWAAFIYVTDRVSSGDMTGAVTGLEKGKATKAKKMGIPANSFILTDSKGRKYGQTTGGLDPAFMLLNTLASFHEMAIYAETAEDRDMAYMTGAWVMGKVMLDRQFLSSIHDLFGLIEEPNPRSAGKLIAGKLGTFMPFAGDLARLSQTPDENLPQRETDDETFLGAAYPTYTPAGTDAYTVNEFTDFLKIIGTEIKNRSPYYNKDRPYRVNGWGEPMLTWGNYIERNVSPSFYQPMNPANVRERDAAIYANGIEHPEPTFTMSFKGIDVDVRDINPPGKQQGWAWQDYQETIGKARAKAVDSLIDAGSLPIENDTQSDTAGLNRDLLQRALGFGTMAGQMEWLGKAYVQDAFAMRGIEITEEMLTPEPPRPVPIPLGGERAKRRIDTAPTFGAQ